MRFSLLIAISMLVYSAHANNYGSSTTNQNYHGGYMEPAYKPYHAKHAGNPGFTNQYNNYGYNYKGKFYNNYPMNYNAYSNQGYQHNLFGNVGYSKSLSGYGQHSHGHTVHVPIPYPISAGAAYPVPTGYGYGQSGFPYTIPVGPYLYPGGRDILGGLFSGPTGRLLGTGKCLDYALKYMYTFSSGNNMQLATCLFCKGHKKRCLKI